VVPVIWALIALATLLAFAHVGVRAARLVEVREELPPLDDDGPAYETYWFKPDRIMFRGKAWRRVDIHWYDETTGERADGVLTPDPDLSAAFREIEAGRERRERIRRLESFRQ
jgi:hypothetical protein